MEQIEILFLGSGDAFCAGGRAYQSIWIKGLGANILLDCGPSTLFRMQQLNLPPNDLDAVVFSHFHADHFFGIVNVDLELMLISERTRPLIYAGAKGLSRQFGRLCSLGYPGIYKNKNRQFQRKFKVLKPGIRTKLLDGVWVTGIPVNHNAESLGYRIELGGKTIAFTGDTAWCENLTALAERVDLFISECEFYHRAADCPTHLSYEEIAEKLAGRCRIVLTHLGQETLENLDKIKLEVASDGGKIVV